MFLKYGSIKINKKHLDAILFIFDKKEIWIPKSQIIELDEINEELEIPSWIAIDKEIEDYEVD